MKINALFALLCITHFTHGMNYTLPNDSTRTEREYLQKIVQLEQEKIALENRKSANQITSKEQERLHHVTVNLNTYQDKLNQCLNARNNESNHK